MTTRVAILGATGSIGRQALDVLVARPERFRIVGLAAGRDASGVERAGRELGARVVVHQRDGESACIELASAPDVDLVVVAIPGIAALRPNLAALEAGKSVALATKEVLVVAGHLIRRHVRGAGPRLRPIDSEHCALWQCLRGEELTDVVRVTLTASGGPFRELPLERLASVTPADALAHPTWNMGPKVTIDSATLVNKAYEVIEARWLFDLPYDRIDVAVHPQSLVHALVELRDGTVKAQLAIPDMRLPIQYALAAPERLPAAVARLDLISAGPLTFGAVDPVRYPCFEVVLEAAHRGAAATAAVNAADEVAVERFLTGEIRFTDIARELERGLRVAEGARLDAEPDVDAILALDAEVRRALSRAAAVA
jgi:1-deoxy-D-xylulose-5-phosphate reductoisomerase